MLSSEELSWINKEHTVRVRIGSAPPFMLTDGEIQGISIDYLTNIFNRNGIKFIYVQESEVTWPQALKYIEQHDVVDMVPTAKITDERKKHMLFTNEYIVAPWVIFTRSEADFVGSLDDLNGKTVSVEEGYVIHDLLKRNYPEINLKVVSAKLDNFAEIPIKDLSTGLVDAYIGNLMMTTYMIQLKGYTNVKVAAPTPFDNHNQAMAVRNDWPELVSIINKSLSSMTPDEHAAILNRWLSIRYEYGINKIYVAKCLLGIGGLAAFIVGLMLFWNRRLKKEVIFRKKIEVELTDSENRLHSFLSNSPVGMGIWDREFRFVYINEILQKINGPSMEEHIGNTLEEVIPKAAPIIRPIFEKILANAKPVINIELSGEVPATPGKITHYMLSYFPIIGKSETLDYIGGIVVDITGRKNAENELRLLSEAIENSLNGFDIVDAQGKFIYANKAFVKMYGYETADEIMGMSPVDLCLDPTLPETLIKTLKEKGEWEFEHVAKRKNGSTFDVLMYARFGQDENGNEIYPTTCIDISERKKALLEKEHLESKLLQAQKMESIGVLAGGIAHEFNNILSIIIGNNELMMEELPEWGFARESSEEIRIAGLRARDVVKQLLTFSRQDNAQKRPLDLGSVVEESMKLIRSSTPTNIDIHPNIVDDVAPVLGNHTQINQVLINLCANASGAMLKTGGVIRIDLRNETIEKKTSTYPVKLKPGRYVKIIVSDTGHGMDKDTLDRIFEPYFTTKEIGEGSGIGLAIVHGIVENHNGVILAESQLKKGTTFTLLFPACEGQLEVKAEKQLELPTGNERILLVDDESSLLKLSIRRLENLGYRVQGTTDPLEALTMFQSNPDDFDLIITDMAMPNMTGDQLVSEIRKIRIDVPTMLCTGYSQKISEKKAYKIGINAFTMKPFNRTDYAMTVRRVLDEANRSE